MRQRRRGRGGRRRSKLPAQLVIISLALVGDRSFCAGATSTASWLSPVSGSWTIATNWSTNPTWPRNGAPTASDTYDVVIGAVGSPYTVTANQFSSAAVDNVAVTSASATLAVGSFNHLNVLSTLSMQAGTLALGGVGSISGGTILLAGGSRMNWTSGDFNGPGPLVVSSGALVNISGPSQRRLNRPIVNAGTVQLTAETFDFANAGTLTNAPGGVLEIGPNVTFDSSVVGSGGIINAGTMIINAGALGSGDVRFGRNSFVNSGHLHIASGRLLFDFPYGPVRFEEGSVVTAGAGFSYLVFGSTVDVAGTTVLMHPDIDLGGNITGAGDLHIGNASVAMWDNAMTGTGRTIIDPGAHVHNGTELAFAVLSRRLLNSGTLSLNNGSVDFEGGTLTNNADGVMRLDAIQFNFDDAGGTLINNGTIALVKPNNAAGSFYDQVPTINNGTIIIPQNAPLTFGVSVFPQRAFTNSGTILLNGQMTIEDGNSTPQLVRLGRISGTGTITVNSRENVSAQELNVGTVILVNIARLTLESQPTFTASRVGTLKISDGFNNLVDVTDGGLVIDNTSGATAVALIKLGRNTGAWDGVRGITSSAARDDAMHTTTLGIVSGADFRAANGASASFGGQTSFLNSSSLIRYTYYGDTDLNGIVNFDDYARIDGGFNNGGTTWFAGDFDLNGVINFDDYSLIDLAFNTQGAPLLQTVPEPIAFVAMVGPAIGLLSRPRRRSRG